MTVYDDLVGQGPVIEQLEAAARAGADALAGAGGGGMTHAWLFTGPPGSGRSVAARAFAAALLCPDLGCGHCASCHQVLSGTHADVEVVRPAGLSYGVRETRELVLRAASSPTGGRWRVVLFEDADRSTEQAANALLKAIEEPPARTVWLLCAPSPDDLVVTIRSRCRLVTLRTPPADAVADVLVLRDGIDPDVATQAARAAQGHIGRARRLATDEEARRRRAEVLAVPSRLTGLGPAVAAAEALVKAAEAEAKAAGAELDATETAALRQALGESAKGRMPRGTAGALKELEDRQKSRATRMKRDALDRALLDLASYYRDLLAVQLGADVTLVNAERARELRAYRGTPEATLQRLEAIMTCRERLEANVNPQLAVEAMTMALRTG
ncbi:DNA polymerase III subunit delta' [Actinoallomurus iriomotensis]|uniref:DNA polymerase III subunit delta n=1 Tax=Actinoallomurus iriomotensis TaxID=478107 RepID=A0A9W6W303_9ACTN|nr:DNA polymerase III subunit delta' [Actinoallomurus iriomotensis]GLY88402.1 DNA polymerase III subunit delta [Actinoallomurus iriomotensis]